VPLSVTSNANCEKDHVPIYDCSHPGARLRFISKRMRWPAERRKGQ